jgi:glycosyltransferase involved in cell wall biosynthesis
MKIAFLTTRFEKPSFRFRVQQFLPYLRANGVVCDCFAIPADPIRRARLFSRMRRYDVVFLQKKMLRWADRFLLRANARRLIYDVDDAIMYRYRGSRPSLSASRERRFHAMVRMSDLVLAGNDFLCRWAADHAARAICFRTVVDTDFYTPGPREGRELLVIGWSGSASTNHYLSIVLPVLDRLAERHHFILRLVSDTREGIPFDASRSLRIEFTPWDDATELGDFRSFDIGLMPLPDDEWAYGKCALKGLLYMACGVPAVCSAVGAITTIVTDGETGLLSASDEEWRQKIECLLGDVALRRRIAEKARELVVSRYSLAVQAPRLLQIIQGLI